MLAALPKVETAEQKEYRRLWRLRNPERVKAWHARSRQKNREKRLAYDRARPPEKRLAYRAKNAEKVSATIAGWKKKNREKCNSYTAKRKAALLKAVPAWADLNLIASVYTKAREISCLVGEPHEVDHVVPLQSKYVCGLHVHDNLQVIPRRLNRRKCNVWWPDCGRKEPC